MAVKFKRKINKTWIVLGVSLLVGLGAAIMAQSFLSQKLREIEERERSRSQISLVVPKFDLEKGTALTADNVAVRSFPKEFAPAEAISPDQFARATGSVLAHPLNGGEAILWSHLEPKRDPNFSARLQPGRRAVTVPVDSIASISGMVQPGDVIDLVITVNDEEKVALDADEYINNSPSGEATPQSRYKIEKVTRTYTLLQSVTVLATGIFTEPGNDEGRGRSYNTVTLDVSPDDAKRVVAARNVARITAFLRAPTDEEPVSTEQTKDLYLVGLKPQILPPPKPAEFRAQVIYGSTPTEAIQALSGPTTSAPSIRQVARPAPVATTTPQAGSSSNSTNQPDVTAETFVSAVEKVIDTRNNNNAQTTNSPATNSNSSSATETKTPFRLVD